MPLSLKNLSKSSRAGLETVGLFLLITLGIFLLIFFTPAVEGAQHVQAGFYNVSQVVGNWADDTFFARQTLKTERAYYQSLAAALAIDTSSIEQQSRKITELESMLDYEQTVDYQTTLARVLSRSLNQNRELLIDKGIGDGMIVGQPVIIGEGQLVGIISDLNNNTAVVRLLTDEHSSVASAILGSDKTIGLVQGRAGYLLSMQFIPQDEQIDLNDVVVTSGLDEQIPSGLVIGVVDELITDDAAAFQEARVKQILHEDDFSYVTVIQMPL